MKNFNEKVMDALREYVENRHNGKINAASRALGLKDPSILSQWLNGKRVPSLSAIGPALDIMGANFLPPDGRLIDYDLVPKVAAKAGAGASLETSDETEGLYAFRKDFMGREHICARNAVMLDVVGDSMEPEFYEGDTLLVDKSDIEIRDGKIYVVTLGDELRVKRIFNSLNGLILRSDNPKYPDIHVEGPDLENFVVHGRVRWHSRIL